MSTATKPPGTESFSAVTEDLVPPTVDELEKQNKQEDEASKRQISSTPELDLSAETPMEQQSSTTTEELPSEPIKTSEQHSATSDPSIKQEPVTLEKINSPAPVKKKRVRKRKSNRAPDAPKFPLTGYVRYINERRETLKSEHPESNHTEITKMLGDEWVNLAEDKKKPYLLAAEKDRERYLQEMKDYNVTHPPPPKKSTKPETAPTQNDSKSKPNDVITESRAHKRPPAKAGTKEIQIFTDEFLEHNKEMESELKILRKSFTDYELQNSNLDRYIENMKSGIEGLNAESAALKTKNAALEKYLTKLKTALASALSSLTLPNEKGATVSNIENYLTELAQMSAPGIINKAKDSIRKLDLQSIQN